MLDMMRLEMFGVGDNIPAGCFVAWCGPRAYLFRASKATLKEAKEQEKMAKSGSWSTVDIHARQMVTVKTGMFLSVAFWDDLEADVFDALVKIPKIGWLTAMGILDGGVETVISAVRDQDLNTAQQIKGVGPKTAINLLKSPILKMMAKVKKKK